MIGRHIIDLGLDAMPNFEREKKQPSKPNIRDDNAQFEESMVVNSSFVYCVLPNDRMHTLSHMHHCVKSHLTSSILAFEQSHCESKCAE
jgi:hypothetical protein